MLFKYFFHTFSASHADLESVTLVLTHFQFHESLCFQSWFFLQHLSMFRIELDKRLFICTLNIMMLQDTLKFLTQGVHFIGHSIGHLVTLNWKQSQFVIVACMCKGIFCDWPYLQQNIYTGSWRLQVRRQKSSSETNLKTSCLAARRLVGTCPWGLWEVFRCLLFCILVVFYSFAPCFPEMQWLFLPCGKNKDGKKQLHRSCSAAAAQALLYYQPVTDWSFAPS